MGSDASKARSLLTGATADSVDLAVEHAPARRGLIAFVCFAAGLVLGFSSPGVHPALWLGFGAGAAGAALFTRGWALRVLLGAGTVALAAGWMALRVHTEPTSSLGRLAQGAAVMPVLVRGTVIDMPHGSADGAGRAHTRFTLELRQAEGAAGWSTVEGRCDVFVSGRMTVRIGDRVQVRGFFLPVSAPANPGERDDRPWARQEGRVGRMSVESAELVSRWAEPAALSELAASAARRAVWELRACAARALLGSIQASDDGSASDEETRRGTALLGALLLGRSDPALRPVAGALSRLGQVHVLSISGFHLAVMAALALLVIRLTGDRGWVEPLLVAALVLVYLCIVPAQAPILRSGLMVLALLLAEATGRRYDRLNLLGWIALALLIWRPVDLWSVGFQLSFGVTAALMGLGARFHRRLFEPRIFGRHVEAQAARDPGLRTVPGMLRAWATGLLSTSVLCWAVATPTVIYHVGIVSPLGAISSVILVPAFTLVLWVGFLVLAIGVVWPGGAALAGGVLERLGEAAAWLAMALDGLPIMAINMPPISAVWTASATAVLVAWLREPRRPRAAVLVAAAIVLGWLVWTLAGAGGAARGVAMRVDALAVGDSSAVLVRAGDSDEAVLWIGSTGSPGDLGRVVPRAARALGCWRVRSVVLGGGRATDLAVLPEICQALGARDALLPAGLAAALEQAGGAPADELRRLRRVGVTIRTVRDGDTLTLGAVTMKLVDPSSRDAGGDMPGMLYADVAHDRSGVPARVLLMGHLRRAEFERAASRGFAGAIAVELPGWRLPRGVESDIGRAGVTASWRSEAARLTTHGERGPAGVAAFSTARDGAVWVELTANREVRTGNFGSEH